MTGGWVAFTKSLQPLSGSFRVKKINKKSPLQTDSESIVESVLQGPYSAGFTFPMFSNKTLCGVSVKLSVRAHVRPVIP